MPIKIMIAAITDRQAGDADSAQLRVVRHDGVWIGKLRTVSEWERELRNAGILGGSESIVQLAGDAVAWEKEQPSISHEQLLKLGLYRQNCVLLCNSRYRPDYEGEWHFIEVLPPLPQHRSAICAKFACPQCGDVYKYEASEVKELATPANVGDPRSVMARIAFECGTDNCPCRVDVHTPVLPGETLPRVFDRLHRGNWQHARCEQKHVPKFPERPEDPRVLFGPHKGLGSYPF